MDSQAVFSRDLSWTTSLHAYDDGLGQTRQKNQMLTFSMLGSSFGDRRSLTDDLRTGKIAGTTNLPTPHELSGPPHHSSPWVGWCRPLKDLPGLNNAHRKCSVSDFGKTDFGSRSQRDAVLCEANDSTALKVVYVGSRFMALAYPCPRTGLCKAIEVPGGIRNVFFFPEFRDEEDRLTSVIGRDAAWRTLAKSAACKDSNNNNSQGSGDSEIQFSEDVKSEAVGGEISAAETSNARCVAASGSKNAAVVEHVDEVTSIRGALEELRSDMDILRYRDIAYRVKKLTGFKVSTFNEYVLLSRFLEREELDIAEAETVVRDFYSLHPTIEKGSISGLTASLVRRVSVILSSSDGQLKLDWATISPFFSSLAHLCGGLNVQDDELKGMIRLAFEMARSFNSSSSGSQASASSSKTATIHDGIRAFVPKMVTTIEVLLDCYISHENALKDLRTRKDERLVSGAEIVQDFNNALSKKRHKGDLASGRAEKKKRRLSAASGSSEIKQEVISLVSDSD